MTKITKDLFKTKRAIIALSLVFVLSITTIIGGIALCQGGGGGGSLFNKIFGIKHDRINADPDGAPPVHVSSSLYAPEQIYTWEGSAITGLTPLGMTETELVIPNVLGGETIYGIAFMAFSSWKSGYSNLAAQSVYIDGLSSIEQFAFDGRREIINLDIRNVDFIDSNAFNLPYVQNIYLENCTIYSRAFENAGIASQYGNFTIKNCTLLGENIFYFGRAWTISIYSCDLYNTESLFGGGNAGDVYLYDVVEIGYRTFDYLKGHSIGETEHFFAPDLMQINERGMCDFKNGNYDSHGIAEIVFPQTLEIIGDEGLRGGRNAITLPTSIRELGVNALSDQGAIFTAAKRDELPSQWQHTETRNGVSHPYGAFSGSMVFFGCEYGYDDYEQGDGRLPYVKTWTKRGWDNNLAYPKNDGGFEKEYGRSSGCSDRVFKPTRRGHTFIGWNTREDGRGAYINMTSYASDWFDFAPDGVWYAIWDTEPTITPAGNVDFGWGFSGTSVELDTRNIPASSTQTLFINAGKGDVFGSIFYQMPSNVQTVDLVAGDGTPYTYYRQIFTPMELNIMTHQPIDDSDGWGKAFGEMYLVGAGYATTVGGTVLDDILAGVAEEYRGDEKMHIQNIRGHNIGEISSHNTVEYDVELFEYRAWFMDDQLEYEINNLGMYNPKQWVCLEIRNISGIVYATGGVGNVSSPLRFVFAPVLAPPKPPKPAGGGLWGWW